MAPGAATSSRPQLARVVKHRGAISATLAYAGNRQGFLLPVADPTVSVRQDGRLALRRRLCPLDVPRVPCRWAPPAEVRFLRVMGGRPAAVVVELYSGGNTCCTETFVALLGPHPHWITHLFGLFGSRLRRIRGRDYFFSIDYRFYCAFVGCAGSNEPIQIWTIDGAGRFGDSTRSFPSLVRADARRQWKYRKDLGFLAGWCADEHSLGHGAVCRRVLGRLPERRSGFVRELNRDLERWGYERR